MGGMATFHSGSASDFLIHVQVTDKVHHKMWFLTVVYGLHSVSDRLPLWTFIHNTAAMLQGVPWLQGTSMQPYMQMIGLMGV